MRGVELFFNDMLWYILGSIISIIVFKLGSDKEWYKEIVKNCGSPIEHSFNHKCKYCGTLYDFNDPIENTIEVKPEDLINVKLRSITKTPIHNSLLLMFSGYKCSMPKVYEFNDKNNNYVSKVEEYINPPKCGFCIELPLFEVEKYGLDYIMYRIRATGIRIKELDNIKQQLIQSDLQYYCRV